jgi:hypothetical protein
MERGSKLMMMMKEEEKEEEEQAEEEEEPLMSEDEEVEYEFPRGVEEMICASGGGAGDGVAGGGEVQMGLGCRFIELTHEYHGNVNNKWRKYQLTASKFWDYYWSPKTYLYKSRGMGNYVFDDYIELMLGCKMLEYVIRKQNDEGLKLDYEQEMDVYGGKSEYSYFSLVNTNVLRALVEVVNRRKSMGDYYCKEIYDVGTKYTMRQMFKEFVLILYMTRQLEGWLKLYPEMKELMVELEDQYELSKISEEVITFLVIKRTCGKKPYDSKKLMKMLEDYDEMGLKTMLGVEGGEIMRIKKLYINYQQIKSRMVKHITNDGTNYHTLMEFLIMNRLGAKDLEFMLSENAVEEVNLPITIMREDYLNSYCGYVEFLLGYCSEVHGLEIAYDLCEKPMTSKALMLAGKIDVVMRHKETGKYMIIDWKRSYKLIEEIEKHGGDEYQEYGGGRVRVYDVRTENTEVGTSGNIWVYGFQEITYGGLVELNHGPTMDDQMLACMHPMRKGKCIVLLMNRRTLKQKKIRVGARKGVQETLFTHFQMAKAKRKEDLQEMERLSREYNTYIDELVWLENT